MDNKSFFKAMSIMYANSGRLDKLREDILKWEIPRCDKCLLIWKYVEHLPYKTIGVRIAEDENLAYPLSERQVCRRHDKAIKLVVPAIIQQVMKS